MIKQIIITALMIALIVLVNRCGSKTQKTESKDSTNVNLTEMQKKVSKYVQVKLTTDLKGLTDKEKKILPFLFDAAQIMDDIYWEQTLGDKDAFLASIKDEDTRKFALINYGTMWDRLDGNKPFVEGYGEKPAGANFYPKDMTKEDFAKIKDREKDSQYSIIRKDDKGEFKVIPYHVAFKEKIEKAAELLRQAAELADDAGLKKYLKLRAEALLTDNYYDSDVAWMDMKKSNIDFVVGPIENYEDGLNGLKAAHESFILIKDIDWSAKLTKFTAMLPDFQKGLPVDVKYKKEQPGTDSDMNVYDALYYAGDCNSGSKTIAINLPNDEKIQLKKGTRKLQLKNSMKAKFDNILVPISNILIAEPQRKYIKFNAFFENVMFHEVSHGMGIKNTINKKGTVKNALKEMYSAVEEGKADILGLYLVTKLYEKGELKEGELMDNYVTFIAGTFRSVRFGAASAHGKANMECFNFMQDNGAFTRNDDGTYTVNFDKMKLAVVKLVQDIMTLQGNGDYDLAKKNLEQNGIIKEQLKADLKRIEEANIPVDIVFEQGKSVVGL